MIERCPEVTAISFPVNFMSLSYLKVLRMSYCTELQSLPDLPSSLETLHIFRCHPELSRQSRNMKGHYVEKLAVVPSVSIEEQNIVKDAETLEATSLKYQLAL